MDRTNNIVARALCGDYDGALAEDAAVAAAAGGGNAVAATAAAASLDPDRNKSPLDDDEDCVMFVPQCSGGRIDPIGGRRLQVQDMKKIQALESTMKQPVMITLTIDRDGTTTGRGFDGPEEGYDYAMPLVSRLLTERLGLKTWARVMEVQKAGWAHWHVVADLAEFDGNLAALRRRCWSIWRDRFGIGSVDIDRVRKSAAGYLANYVMKKWEFVPRWMGESCKKFRIVGYSLAANRVIRAVLGIESSRRAVAGELRPTRRKARSLFERLSTSGLSTAVVLRVGGMCRYVGSLAADLETLLAIHESVPGLQVTASEDHGARVSMIVQAFVHLQQRVRAVADALDRLGVPEIMESIACSRMRNWKAAA